MANQIPIILSAGRQRQIPNADNLAVLGMVVAQGSISASRPMLDLSATVNNAGVDFQHVKVAITNSNSGPFSTGYELVVDGNSVFSVNYAGDIGGNSIAVLGQISGDSLVVITSANIPRLDNFTVDGAVMTSNSDGTLVIEEKAEAVFSMGFFYSAY